MEVLFFQMEILFFRRHIDFEDNKIYNFLYENKDIFKIKDLKEIY